MTSHSLFGPEKIDVEVATVATPGKVQHLSLAPPVAAAFERAGVTVTALRKPTSYIETAGDGTWARLTGSQVSEPGCGPSIYTASSGTVVYAGWLGPDGNSVLINHGDGTQTGYAHNSSLLVVRGQQVVAGALVGTTGAYMECRGPLEGRFDGARVDPQLVMRSRGVFLG